MERFRGYACRSERVTVAEKVYEILMPARPDALVDDPAVQQRFERDEYMPYWATLWPAALLLADEVARWPVVTVQETAESSAATPMVLELGCGLGLVGLVAATRGYRVTVSDYDADARAFAVENARRNGGVEISAIDLDWRSGRPDLRFERIVAADVLYEARNLAPVAAFIRAHLAPGGFALISDPQRSTADGFADTAADSGLRAQVAAVERPRATGEPALHGRIFRLERALAGPQRQVT